MDMNVHQFMDALVLASSIGGLGVAVTFAVLALSNRKGKTPPSEPPTPSSIEPSTTRSQTVSPPTVRAEETVERYRTVMNEAPYKIQAFLNEETLKSREDLESKSINDEPDSERIRIKEIGPRAVIDDIETDLDWDLGQDSEITKISRIQ